ncbi:MAG: hypothetical protein LQ352_007172, partial [Teloschistes flavicans]
MLALRPRSPRRRRPHRAPELQQTARRPAVPARGQKRRVGREERGRGLVSAGSRFGERELVEWGEGGGEAVCGGERGRCVEVGGEREGVCGPAAAQGAEI